MPTLFDISVGSLGPRIFRGTTSAVLSGGGGGGNTDPYGSLVSLLMHFNPVPTFPPEAVAFWKLDSLDDSSGNSNTLSNVNGAQFVSGKISDCAQFDGSNYLSINSGLSPTLNPSGTFAVSFWAYPTELYNYGAFFSGTGDNGYGFNIHSDQDGDLFFNNAQASDCFVSNVFTNNAWHHMVCMKDGENNKLIVYKNNNKIYDAGAGQSYSTDFYRITIGGYRYPGSSTLNQPQIGLIDAVGIWNRLLTEEEIAQLYSNGDGLEP